MREYLIENPEVIEQAMRALRAKRDAARQQVVRNVIAGNRDAIFSHSMTPVSGDVEGDVTLVEFFDYQCGYCKRALAPMKELLASDAMLRVVWKEFPIRQFDYAIASRGFHERVTVRALNHADEWGPSDHCRLMIEVAA